MATLTTLTAQVYARLGVPTTDSVFTSAIVTGFINDALAEIATEHAWPWLQDYETISTNVNNPSAVTSAAYVGTTNVLVHVGSDLIPLEHRTYDELLEGYATAAAGRPEVYAVHFDRLQLRPAPDTTYTFTHEFIKGETALVSGSDVPLLPDQYSAAAANLAVAIALGRSKEDQRAAAALTAYNRWLSKMLDNRRRDRRPGRVRVRRGSWI